MSTKLTAEQRHRARIEARKVVERGEHFYDRIHSYPILLPTMPNLPWLVAMARQCLRGEDAAAWPLTVYEAGAMP